MNKNKPYIRAYSQEHYPIHRRVGVRAPGRVPSKLGLTLRLMNVGDAFHYPYTTANSVHRLARQLDLGVTVGKTEGGFWVGRIW
jgi:hypothetical protein